MRTSARAEWDPLTDVMIHRPGIEMFFGLLEPYSFLYERAFSMDAAVYEHTTLEHALEEAGVRVHRLKRGAVQGAQDHPELVRRVRRAAVELVQFEAPRDLLPRVRKAFRENVGRLDPETLFNIFLLRPRVRLSERPGERVILPRVELEVPLANLLYLRDQQALGPNGFILGSMSKPQRRGEPLLTGSILTWMGAEILGRVRPPGTFEGGDFLPAGDFALLGLGDRTNHEGVRQILKMDLGFREVAVVHQPSHPLIPGDERDPMVDMHVDTYFNFAGEKTAVGLVSLLDRARVDRYRPSGRGYQLVGPPTTLSKFLKEKDFTVIPLTTLEQLSYSSNFLCLKDRKILAVDAERTTGPVLEGLARAARADPHRYGALLRQAQQDLKALRKEGNFFPHKPELYAAKVETIPLDLRELTGSYGGAHCMTCALNRAPGG